MSILKKLVFASLFIGAAWNAIMVLVAVIYSVINPHYIVIKSNCIFFLGISICCALVLWLWVAVDKARHRKK